MCLLCRRGALIFIYFLKAEEGEAFLHGLKLRNAEVRPLWVWCLLWLAVLGLLVDWARGIYIWVGLVTPSLFRAPFSQWFGRSLSCGLGINKDNRNLRSTCRTYRGLRSSKTLQMEIEYRAISPSEDWAPENQNVRSLTVTYYCRERLVVKLIYQIAYFFVLNSHISPSTTWRYAPVCLTIKVASPMILNLIPTELIWMSLRSKCKKHQRFPTGKIVDLDDLEH